MYLQKNSGLIYLISGIGSPVFGLLIDGIGLNVFFVLGACVLTLIGHGTFLVCLVWDACVNPYVGTVLMGLGYSMLAGSLWPIIALVVPQHRQGTAYGKKILHVNSATDVSEANERVQLSFRYIFL